MYVSFFYLILNNIEGGNAVTEVYLLSQDALGGPIEADYSVVLHLSYCFNDFPL